MKDGRLLILSMAAIVGLWAATAHAQTCDTTFTGVDEAAWQDSYNWDVRAPLSTDRACVPVSLILPVLIITFGPPCRLRITMILFITSFPFGFVLCH